MEKHKLHSFAESHPKIAERHSGHILTSRLQCSLSAAQTQSVWPENGIGPIIIQKVSNIIREL